MGKEKCSRTSPVDLLNSFHLPTVCFLCPADPVYERTIVCFRPVYLRGFLVTRIVFIVCGVFLLGERGVGLCSSLETD